MVVNVVVLASFTVIAVVGALLEAVVRVAVVAVVGSIQRRDMASSSFSSRFRSGRELPSRRSCKSYLIYDDCCLIFLRILVVTLMLKVKRNCPKN